MARNRWRHLKFESEGEQKAWSLYAWVGEELDIIAPVDRMGREVTVHDSSQDLDGVSLVDLTNGEVARTAFAEFLLLQESEPSQFKQNVISFATTFGLLTSPDSVEQGITGYGNSLPEWQRVARDLTDSIWLWNAVYRNQVGALKERYPSIGVDSLHPGRVRRRTVPYSRDSVKARACDQILSRLREHKIGVSASFNFLSSRFDWRKRWNSLREFLWLYLAEAISQGYPFDQCPITHKWFVQFRENGGVKKIRYFDAAARQKGLRERRKRARQLHFEEGLGFDQIAELPAFAEHGTTMTQVRAWIQNFDSRGRRIRSR